MFITTQGKSIRVSKIIYATIFPPQVTLYPVGHQQINIIDGDKDSIGETLRSKGFVGDTTLINPDYVSVVTDGGILSMISMDGINKSLVVRKEYGDRLIEILTKKKSKV